MHIPMQYLAKIAVDNEIYGFQHTTTIGNQIRFGILHEKVISGSNVVVDVLLDVLAPVEMQALFHLWEFF